MGLYGYLKGENDEKVPILFILCLLLQSVAAQSFRETRPANVGFIAERLNRIDSTIIKSVTNGELEGVRIISRKSVELMRRGKIDRNDDGEPDFGLGFRVINDIAETGELGSDGAYSWGRAAYTSYWIDPQENLIGVFMSQLRPSKTDVSSKFRTLVYQALE